MRRTGSLCVGQIDAQMKSRRGKRKEGYRNETILEPSLTNHVREG
eukprot:gene4478-3271_t